MHLKRYFHNLHENEFEKETSEKATKVETDI